MIKHFIHQAIFPVQLNISRHSPRKCLTPDSRLFVSVSAESCFPFCPLSTSEVVCDFSLWVDLLEKILQDGASSKGDDAGNPGATCLWPHCCRGHWQLQHHLSLVVFSFGEGRGTRVQGDEFIMCCSS